MLEMNFLKGSVNDAEKQQKIKKVLYLYFSITSFIFLGFCWSEVFSKYDSQFQKLNPLI